MMGIKVSSPVTHSATSSSVFTKKAGSPELASLSMRTQEMALKYVDLCKRFSIGASDPDFIESLEFSKREVELLQELNPTERAAYELACKNLIASTCPKKHSEVVQASQNAAVLSQFNTRVQVPADGNCGLHAFAVGLVDTMSPQDTIHLGKIIRKQIDNKQLVLSRDVEIVLDRLDRQNFSRDDAVFMTAFAKILRQVGHHTIPEYYKDHIKEMGDSPEVRSVLSNLIPKRDGKWADHEGLICLGRILGKKVCIVRHMSSGNPVLTGDKVNPDIVIDHHVNHFTPRLKSR